jgi:hypothetical protein
MATSHFDHAFYVLRMVAIARDAASDTNETAEEALKLARTTAAGMPAGSALRAQMEHLIALHEEQRKLVKELTRLGKELRAEISKRQMSTAAQVAARLSENNRRSTDLAAQLSQKTKDFLLAVREEEIRHADAVYEELMNAAKEE